MTSLVDWEVEKALVGIALLADVAARAIVDRGVTPDQFVSEAPRTVMRAIFELVNEGATVDISTVASRLHRQGQLEYVGGYVGVDAMTADGSAVGTLPTHCDTIIELARWRHQRDAATAMTQAAETLDRDAFEHAENSLWQTTEQRRRKTDWTPEEAGADFMKGLDAEEQDVFPWPFEKLNLKTDGGAARGEITVLAGPVTHGKSAFLDMCLESMHKPGLTVRLYLNEMKRRQRLARVCARRSGVTLSAIQLAMRGRERLLDIEREQVRESWEGYPINIKECSGWSIEQICRHAKRFPCDVLALDILNRLPFGDTARSRTQQLEDAANQLDQLAKERDMHIIVVTHLNRNRAALGGKAPIPSLTDIKECAALAEIADNVLFVWRQPDENGDPLDEGMVRFAKNRTGDLGGLEVRFIGSRQIFHPLERHLQAA